MFHEVLEAYIILVGMVGMRQAFRTSTATSSLLLHLLTYLHIFSSTSRDHDVDEVGDPLDASGHAQCDVALADDLQESAV
jgi:hypothetical protein